jgi:single-stranded-DNA-specific exonuclease
LNGSALNWIEPAAAQIPDEIRDLAGTPWFLAEALVRRGLSDSAALRAFFDPGLYIPADPASLPDLTRTADRLEQAIRSGERIGVWGDFDVDGQTATAVLVHIITSRCAHAILMGSPYLPWKISSVRESTLC